MLSLSPCRARLNGHGPSLNFTFNGDSLCKTHFSLSLVRVSGSGPVYSLFSLNLKVLTGAARSVVIKLLDLYPQGWWFIPWCGRDKIRTTVGPLSKALNPALP